MDIELLRQRAKAFDYLFDAVVVTDLAGNITDWNKGSEALYGYPKEQVLGRSVSLLHVPEDVDHVTAEVIAAVEKYGKWNGEVRMLHQNGNIGWIESMCVPIFDDDENMIGALGINRDITARREESEQLRHLAHYDQLTAIPNRYLLLDRVEHLIAQCQRNKSKFTLLFLDIDHFKTFNDTRGHAFGDQILKGAVNCFKQSIRHSDTLARIGGDEFVILLENTSDASDIAATSNTILETLDQGFTIDGEKIEIYCSIGVAVFPDQGSTADELLVTADTAMYKARSVDLRTPGVTTSIEEPQVAQQP